MNIGLVQKVGAALACVGMLIPSAALAETGTETPTEAFTDIVLGHGGLLTGHVVDGQGLVQPGAEVSIQYRQHEIARTVTDDNGQFAVRGLRGGQYLILSTQSATVVRAWAARTAPPAATESLLLVNSDQPVRGQFGMLGGISNTTLIGIGVAAAAIGVGIAVAVSEDDDHS